MTTNGVLLPKMAADLKEAGLSRVNISARHARSRASSGRSRAAASCSRRFSTASMRRLRPGSTPVKINAVAVRSLDQGLPRVREAVHRSPAARAVHRVHARGRGSGSHGCGWGKDDVVPSEELFEIINERARAAGMDELVPAGNDRPLGWGARALLRVPERAGARWASSARCRVTSAANATACG